MLLKVHGDLACFSDALRTTGERYRTELVLLSLIGSRNAVKATWAKLSASRRGGRHESVDIGGTYVAKAENVSYTMVSAPLAQGRIHCVLFHQQLGHTAPDLGYVYQTGPDADRRYFERLARWCPVPLRASWRTPLWTLGQKGGGIVEVPGHGREVWRIETTRKVWEPIIQTALLAGDLT